MTWAPPHSYKTSVVPFRDGLRWPNIDATQNMLKKACPVPGSWLWPDNDLCHPARQVHSNFEHTGQGHWVTISTIGTSHSTMIVFILLCWDSPRGTDCCYSYPRIHRCSYSVRYIRLRTIHNCICNWTCSRGGSWSCFFVVVFFVVVVLFFCCFVFFVVFYQWNMRTHLRQCFEDGELMKMFPVL